MPQPASQSNATPPLPPGYTLDSSPTNAIPPLPPGYKLDAQQASAGPSEPSEPFMGRVVDRIGQNLEGMAALPGKIAKDSKGTALGMIDGATSIATPGIIYRLMHKDDPANIVGDASAALGTEMLGREVQPPVRGSLASAMKPAESTGRLGRLLDVAKDEVHLPLAGRVSKYWKAWKGPEPPPPPTPGPPLSSDAAGIESGWPKPSPEVIQARGLMEGAKPVVDPAAGLGKIPVRGSVAEKMAAPTNAETSPIATTPAAQQSAAPPPAPKPSPRPIARGTLNKMMDQELGNALGAKPLDPKIPLRKQMPGRMPEAAESADLLEGHTPTESSWIKSYKYEPATREFEMHPKSGNAVRLGDVSPEDAAEFGKAESKGKAWQAIQRSPVIAKRINGQWQPVKPAAAR